MNIVDDGQRQTPEHWYTISSPCEPDGSGELKMELICDTPLPMDKEGHVDNLNYFNEGHSLDVLSREDIETKLHKSFNTDMVSLSRIF